MIWEYSLLVERQRIEGVYGLGSAEMVTDHQSGRYQEF